MDGHSSFRWLWCTSFLIFSLLWSLSHGQAVISPTITIRVDDEHLLPMGKHLEMPLLLESILTDDPSNNKTNNESLDISAVQESPSSIPSPLNSISKSSGPTQPQTHPRQKRMANGFCLRQQNFRKWSQQIPMVPGPNEKLPNVPYKELVSPVDGDHLKVVQFQIQKTGKFKRFENAADKTDAEDAIRLWRKSEFQAPEHHSAGFNSDGTIGYRLDCQNTFHASVNHQPGVEYGNYQIQKNGINGITSVAKVVMPLNLHGVLNGHQLPGKEYLAKALFKSLNTGREVHISAFTLPDNERVPGRLAPIVRVDEQ